MSITKTETNTGSVNKGGAYETVCEGKSGEEHRSRGFASRDSGQFAAERL